MVDNRQTISDDEAVQAAVNWGMERYNDADLNGRVATREGDEVFVDLEIPEHASVMMVHVRRGADGKLIVAQQDVH
jgi:hypothetical protein